METTVDYNKKESTYPIQLKMNIIRYIAVCVFLAVVNYIASPSYWWVLWVITGWGLDLALDIINFYFTKQEEEKK